MLFDSVCVSSVRNKENSVTSTHTHSLKIFDAIKPSFFLMRSVIIYLFQRQSEKKLEGSSRQTKSLQSSITNILLLVLIIIFTKARLTTNKYYYSISLLCCIIDFNAK